MTSEPAKDSQHEYLFNYTIQKQDIDGYGHVNNARYLVILEMARTQILKDYNIKIADIKKEKKGPTILEINIKYKRELFEKTPVVIKTKITPKNSFIWYFYQSIESGESVVNSEAVITAAYFDLEKRKLISFPETWVDSILKA